jgi:hypothetical protein
MANIAVVKWHVYVCGAILYSTLPEQVTELTGGGSTANFVSKYICC